nr:hypothetical protein [Pseudomonadota bacterium]
KNITSTVAKSLNQNEQLDNKFGIDWGFNLNQFKNPAGVSFNKKGAGRPFKEDDPQRRYERHKLYKKRNPKTGELETHKTQDERGHAKIGRWLLSKISLGLIPLYTKKTSVTIAPKDGVIAFYGGCEDPIGIALDLNKLNTKGEKYVFPTNAFTRFKWWWRWREEDLQYKMLVRRSVSIQQIRNNNSAMRHNGVIPEHNEMMACLTKEALIAVVVSSDKVPYRINALLRKLIIKYELGIDLPILIMGTLNEGGDFETPLPTQEYTVEQQLRDLFSVVCQKAEGQEIVDAVARHYSPDKDNPENAKHAFVRTLVNSHPVNWATLFTTLNSHEEEERFKEYIKEATHIDLDRKVDYIHKHTHLAACAG